MCVPRLKGRFDFRLGTSSYIIPADIEPNVRALAPFVDDIELVLFESDEFSNLPDERTIPRLANIAEDHDLTYTVHFPLDTQLGARDEVERRASVEKCLRVYRLTRSLSPHAWIVHFHGERRGSDPAADIEGWLDALRRSVGDLLEGGIPPGLTAVETLDYPFDVVWPIVSENELSVCIDVGHLIVNGYDPVATTLKYREACRVVHLHGVRNGKDHLDLGGMDRSLLRKLIRLFETPEVPERVVTLELFSRSDFECSMNVLGGLNSEDGR
ncbi:MAG: sugar phosphate isomerase/epimerase [Candidatus Pacebacteria bacterium]|nr:sugar phosphate isomerase/epimerase [Candidatus Paceibacterota bacterium]